MKNIVNKLLILVLLVSAGIGLVPQSVLAANAQLYLNPAGGSYTSGQSVTVTIRVNAQAPINAVQANLIYPTDKFTVTGVSYANTAFSLEGESVAGGGSIRMGRATSTSFTGDRIVGSVSFSVISTSGSGSIAFAGGTILANDGITVSSSTSGGSYSFYVPATPIPKAATSKTPTPSPSSKVATPTPSVTPVPVTVKPEVTSTTLASKDSGQSSLVVKTNEPTRLIVEYGLTTSYGLTLTGNDSSAEHTLVLDTKYLLPKTTYHYRVNATDTNGNSVATTDKNFTTPGLPAQITVMGSDNQPLASAKVTVDGETKTTDTKGVVVFDLGLGQKTATIQYGNQTALKNFVLGAETTSTSPKVLVANIQAKKSFPFLPLGLILLLVTAVIGAGSSFLRRKNVGIGIHPKPVPVTAATPVRTPTEPSLEPTPQPEPTTPKTDGKPTPATDDPVLRTPTVYWPTNAEVIATPISHAKPIAEPNEIGENPSEPTSKLK